MRKKISLFFTPLRWHVFREAGFIPVVALLIVGTILSWVTYEDYRQAQVSEYRILEAYARNADVQIAEALHKISGLLSQVAEARLKNKTMQGSAFTAQLERQRQEVPGLRTLLVSDAGGIIRAATDASLVGRNISGESCFTVHQSSPTPAMFMSRPDMRLLGTAAVSLSLPIIDSDGQFLGIVDAAISFDFFPGILRAINPDDSASMSVIFNRDGDLLYRRENPEKFFGNNIAKVSQVFREHYMAGTQVTRHIGPSFHDGKTRLFLVREVGDTGLGLILSRQLDEVIALWQRKTGIYALAFLFTAVLVTFLAIAAAHRKREMLAGKVFTELLIETANVMVVGLDSAGRITIFNETAERLTGYTRAEVLGRMWIRFAIPAKEASSVQKLFAPFLQGGALPHTFEYTIAGKSGQQHTISWQNSVIPEPRSAICFGIDVTEHNQMDIAFAEAKRKAEESSLAKTKFLAAASHDLRQPIHAQGLFLSALSNTELTPHQSEIIAKAIDASKATNDMLNELLDYSRIEAGVIEPKMQPFRVQSLLNKLEREFELQADAKGLFYRSRETSLVVNSDPMLVEFILRNLLANAIRYTLHGGLLVACRKRGGQAVLEVWDTGIGIATEHQQDVFNEFYQLNIAERKDTKGLGLGLAIAQGLAHTLRSSLALSSTLHRGSVFRLALPITIAALPLEKPQPDSDVLRLMNLRILVIDDDEIVRNGMFYQLREWGFKCVAAESIEEAFTLARIQLPNAVICDYRLREQRSGLEAIAALRAEFGENLPALLITGDTAPDCLQEAQASGIRILHKPVEPGHMYGGLLEILPT